MYVGEVSIGDEAQLPEVLEAAAYLQMSELLEAASHAVGVG